MVSCPCVQQRQRLNLAALQVKKETWEALNKEWVEKEELKKQQQAEAEKVSSAAC